MRILGVDPGSLHVGWGVVEVGGTLSQLAHVASGTVDAPRGELATRLCCIAEALEAVLRRFVPQVAAMEQAFFAKNARTALVLGHARGAILVTLARHRLRIDEYSPRTVKQAVGSGGGATKEQVAHMVRMILGPHSAAALDKAGLDTTDALAVAICHAQHLSSRHRALQGEARP